jgi:hypothetical protein
MLSPVNILRLFTVLSRFGHVMCLFLHAAYLTSPASTALIVTQEDYQFEPTLYAALSYDVVIFIWDSTIKDGMIQSLSH